MGIEIERKYLIDLAKWQQVSKPKGQHYRQGYLLTDPDKTIRVRLTDTAAYLTIKGATVNATRSEYEYEIPPGEAKELLDSFSVPLIWFAHFFCGEYFQAPAPPM